MSGECACVQSVWCAACACVCAVTINNKQRAATMATDAAVPDQTRDSLLRRRSVSLHGEGVWSGGVAGFRFAWLARLEPFVSRAGVERRGTPRGLIWLA